MGTENTNKMSKAKKMDLADYAYHLDGAQVALIKGDFRAFAEALRALGGHVQKRNDHRNDNVLESHTTWKRISENIDDDNKLDQYFLKTNTLVSELKKLDVSFKNKISVITDEDEKKKIKQNLRAFNLAWKMGVRRDLEYKANLPIEKMRKPIKMGLKAFDHAFGFDTTVYMESKYAFQNKADAEATRKKIAEAVANVSTTGQKAAKFLAQLTSGFFALACALTTGAATLALMLALTVTLPYAILVGAIAGLATLYVNAKLGLNSLPAVLIALLNPIQYLTRYYEDENGNMVRKEMGTGQKVTLLISILFAVFTASALGALTAVTIAGIPALVPFLAGATATAVFGPLGMVLGVLFTITLAAIFIYSTAEFLRHTPKYHWKKFNERYSQAKNPEQTTGQLKAQKVLSIIFSVVLSVVALAGLVSTMYAASLALAGMLTFMGAFAMPVAMVIGLGVGVIAQLPFVLGCAVKIAERMSAAFVKHTKMTFAVIAAITGAAAFFVVGGFLGMVIAAVATGIVAALGIVGIVQKLIQSKPSAPDNAHVEMTNNKNSVHQDKGIEHQASKTLGQKVGAGLLKAFNFIVSFGNAIANAALAIKPFIAMGAGLVKGFFTAFVPSFFNSFSAGFTAFFQGGDNAVAVERDHALDKLLMGEKPAIEGALKPCEERKVNYENVLSKGGAEKKYDKDSQLPELNSGKNSSGS